MHSRRLVRSGWRPDAQGLRSGDRPLPDVQTSRLHAASVAARPSAVLFSEPPSHRKTLAAAGVRPPQPSLDRAGNQKTECWSGDYHHGAFVDKQGDTLRFLPVWPESDLSACEPTCPAPNLEVHANLVTVREVAR